ncbi:MAG: hypothetical protein R2698_03155 [Microthrixaceae bacterium]
MRRRLLEGCELAAHEIVTRAMRRSNSSEFGPMSWTEPLEVLTRSLVREAALTRGGRRVVRDRLVTLLQDRTDDAPSPEDGDSGGDEPGVDLVVITAPTWLGLQRAASERKGRAGGGQTLILTDDTTMGPEFCSLCFERWAHVPTYAEWLDEADLGANLRAARRRIAVRATRRGVAEVVVASVVLHDRLLEVADAWPSARFETTGPADAEVRPEHLDAEVAEVIAERRRHSARVDPDKVGRYWRWRVGALATRGVGQRAELMARHPERISRGSSPRSPS